MFDRALILRVVLSLLTISGCSSDSESKNFANNENNVDNILDPTDRMAEFAEIHTSGITPTAGQCNGSTGEVSLRFVLEDDIELPMLPGTSLDQGGRLSLGAGDVTISDGVLFETPDVSCQSDSDCRLMGEGFTCAVARPAFSEEQRRCQLATDISLDGPLEFVSDVESPQLFGVVFENSGSLEGWLPEDVALRFPDFDGDGAGEGSQDRAPSPARASDSDARRFVALTGIRDTLVDASAFASELGERDTLVGLWTFSGTSSADVRSAIAEETPENTLFTSDLSLVASAQDSINAPAATRANVYQALDSVMDEGFGLSEYSDFEKTLVLFVDGPDDLRLPMFTAENMIEKANEQGIRIFIVHLDSELETESFGVPLLRDDFQYWQNQDAPCASDSECRNYESCRVPTAYSSSSGEPVDISTDDTYCMPERDANGRIGPIFDYQRIACETGGGYIYVKTARAMRRRVQWLPLTMDGLWKIDGTIDEAGQVPSNQGYAVQGILQIDAANTTRSFPFSQIGDPVAGREDDDQDTRTILFVD